MPAAGFLLNKENETMEKLLSLYMVNKVIEMWMCILTNFFHFDFSCGLMASRGLMVTDR